MAIRQTLARWIQKTEKKRGKANNAIPPTITASHCARPRRNASVRPMLMGSEDGILGDCA
jgi:hypothetical protein